MDLEQLTYFKVAASGEHLTEAAKQLGVSQSALSRSIARTEDYFGVQLFDRVGRGVRLNKCGKLLLTRLERVLFEVAMSKSELGSMSGEAERGVAFGFCPTIASDIVPRTIGRFAQEHGGVSVSLAEGTLPRLERQLLEGKIDLCLSGPAFTTPAIVCEPLWTEDLVALVPAGHKLIQEAEIAFDAFAGEAIVALRPGFGLREDLERLCALAAFHPRIAFEAEELTTLISFVEEGFGVALIPVSAYNGGKRAVALRIKGPDCRRTVALSWIRDKYLNKPTRQLREAIISQLGVPQPY